MINVEFDTKIFTQEMNNIAEYAVGFLEGVHRGRKDMMFDLGEKTRELLEQFVDSSARVSPDILHHVYEWYMTGSPQARLFSITSNSSTSSISFEASFTQSKSIKAGAKKPFYNKAVIMERGISLTIQPRDSKVLVFEENGQTVFTKNPVVVQNPGGPQVAGSFERVFEQFFNSYFKQSFMRSSGLAERIGSVEVFARNMAKGKKFGRAAGTPVGYGWITGKGGGSRGN